MINLFEDIYTTVYDRMDSLRLWAFFGGMVIIFLIIIIGFFIFLIIGKWKLFKKAGKNGWESIIPFYSNWVYVEIAGLEWWYFLFLVAPYITSFIDNSYLSTMARTLSILGLFFCNYNISKKLRRDTLFAVLLTIFPYIMIPLVGFSDDYKWDDSVDVKANGPIDNNSNVSSVGNNDNKEATYCSQCGCKLKKTDKFCGNCGKEM